ncbi:hypothetical protein MLD38_033745 [Melastoma candidum]|uniref:Uncharacterized protein n=1 Tax=Melastoma candidum TaxID=119954 RepID=A0ACB9M7W1_9MYRT|nr:hypothetical protein MLD38_033745 [Melastoma candidum]
MGIFLGDKGDTDHEYLLTGLHTSIILNGTMEFGGKRLHRRNENFRRGDVVLGGCPRITTVENGLKSYLITAALTNLGVK